MKLSSSLTDTKVSEVLDRREADQLALASDMLDFYLKRYPEVYVVICKQCGEKLILEYVDPSKPNLNHAHLHQVVELSKMYASCRVRTDGVMGYKCKCGNSNIWAYVEWQVTKHGGANFPPHEVQMVKDFIASSNYSPQVTIEDRDMIIEDKFIVRKLNA